MASPSPPAQATAEQVVADLLDALGGDSARAWALLTREAQQGFGSYPSFQDLETEYAEGLAQFAGVPAVVLPLDRGAQVVVLSGEVSREGDTETDAVALPVREQDGALRVDLRAPDLPTGASVELPEREGEVRSGTELRATVPAQSRATAFVDQQEQEVSTRSVDGDRTLVTLSPRLAAGAHVLTVAAVRADGVVVADAVAFRVS